MNNFDYEIREILHKQQVLEYLKTDSRGIDISSSAYTQIIIDQYRPKNSFGKLMQKVLAYSFIAIILFSTVITILCLLLSALFPEITDSDFITSVMLSYTLGTLH